MHDAGKSIMRDTNFQQTLILLHTICMPWESLEMELLDTCSVICCPASSVFSFWALRYAGLPRLPKFGRPASLIRVLRACDLGVCADCSGFFRVCTHQLYLFWSLCKARCWRARFACFKQGKPLKDQIILVYASYNQESGFEWAIERNIARSSRQEVCLVMINRSVETCNVPRLFRRWWMRKIEDYPMAMSDVCMCIQEL